MWVDARSNPRAACRGDSGQLASATVGELPPPGKPFAPYPASVLLLTGFVESDRRFRVPDARSNLPPDGNKPGFGDIREI
jgi:hypothetical protein